ncbi:MFS transporter [Rhodococcus opacus]|uniref:MFS transporter n=1 Tax=Rhodococcus opacus TaxID=37919 RepID=UPI0024BA9283|nr:MFS transporter [Rhodococcus opacus]MDJ0419873.1 MFS transporter [Rhodococcus opacus]MDV6245268.1 MFS transporter [Rhodococcus opacus]
MTNKTTEPTVVEQDNRASSAVKGAAIGFYVDMFDVYLPVIALAPAMMFFVSPELSIGAKSLIAGMIFASTLVARPLGSTIFGVLADKIGRRLATIYAVIGCGITTLATAFLPGFQHIGVSAVVILIALRFLGGIFMGGEYTGAVPLAMESSPISKRGMYGGVIAATFPLAYCTISGISFLLLQTMPADGLMSAYVQWGWRIPFVIGAVATFWFAYYYAKTVHESESWIEAKEDRDNSKASSFRTLMMPQNKRSLIRIFILMTGVWFGSNVVSVILPQILREDVGISVSGATGVWIICQIVLIGGYLASGLISQKIGRRAFFLGCGITMATISGTAVTLLATGTVSGYAAVTIVATLALLAGTTTFGSVPTLVCESFPVDVRGTGYGLGYSLAIIIPSFYAFYQELLTAIMPRAYAPMVLLVLGGVLVATGALMGPDTRNRDLSMTTEQLYGPNN